MRSDVSGIFWRTRWGALKKGEMCCGMCCEVLTKRVDLLGDVLGDA